MAFEISRLALDRIYPNHYQYGPTGPRKFPRTLSHQTIGHQAPLHLSSETSSSINLGLDLMTVPSIDEFSDMFDNVETLKDWKATNGDDFFDFSSLNDCNNQGILEVLPSPESLDPNVPLTRGQLASVVSFLNRITDAFHEMVIKLAGDFGLTLNFGREDAYAMGRRLVCMLYPNHPMLGPDGPDVLH